MEQSLEQDLLSSLSTCDQNHVSPILAPRVSVSLEQSQYASQPGSCSPCHHDAVPLPGQHPSQPGLLISRQTSSFSALR